MRKPESQSILFPLFYNGRFLLLFTGLVLLFSGLFVIVQSFTGHFLPHDVAFLGMDAERLSVYYGGRITAFMFYDRVAFGGSIMAVGMIYMWLAEFPLRYGQAWAWWVLLLSGVIGFGSFLTYAGYGYLDKWHAIATGLLLPFFALGLYRSYQFLQGEKSIRSVLKIVNRAGVCNTTAIGFMLLQFTGLGMLLGGLSIMFIGITSVFVPQDLEFIGIVSCGPLTAINKQSVPLIAHDRACFGGGVATIGLIVFFTSRRARERKSMWEVLFLSLNTGFAAALCIHFYIGYTELLHIAPALVGWAMALTGLALTFPFCMQGKEKPAPEAGNEILTNRREAVA